MKQKYQQPYPKSEKSLYPIYVQHELHMRLNTRAHEQNRSEMIKKNNNNNPCYNAHLCTATAFPFIEGRKKKKNCKSYLIVYFRRAEFLVHRCINSTFVRAYPEFKFIIKTTRLEMKKNCFVREIILKEKSEKRSKKTEKKNRMTSKSRNGFDLNVEKKTGKNWCMFMVSNIPVRLRWGRICAPFRECMNLLTAPNWDSQPNSVDSTLTKVPIF